MYFQIISLFFLGIPKKFYLISGIILLVAALLNIVIIKNVSLFAIYAVVIGIFNIKYSK